jgi:hypothetical protein
VAIKAETHKNVHEPTGKSAFEGDSKLLTVAATIVNLGSEGCPNLLDLDTV